MLSSIKAEIQDVVLDFFDVIGSDISCNGGVYNISVPEHYRDLFAHDLCIAFDKAATLGRACELVIPGSKILSTIMDLCINKGPVAFKIRTAGSVGSDHTESDTGTAKIRYYFLVNFSGRLDVMHMDYVDVDLHTLHGVNDTATNAFQLDTMGPNVTSTYTTALRELKKRHADTKDEFLDNAKDVFLGELEQFLNRHNSQMRELDRAINYREEKSNDLTRSKEFRFQTVDRIEDLEKEREQIVDALQQKHRVMLEYRLVACAVIRD